jgi:hypothetical protein
MIPLISRIGGRVVGAVEKILGGRKVAGEMAKLVAEPSESAASAAAWPSIA